MTNEEIVHLLRLVEADVSVEKWVVDGVHVWPLFRAQLTLDNFFMYRRATATRARTNGASGRSRLLSRLRVEPLQNVARSAVSYARARVEDRVANDRLHKVDALLYSDGVSFLRLEGKYFERFCDPIRERLARQGRSSLMLTPLGRYHHPRCAPSVFVQPRLDVAQLKGALVGRLHRRRDYELPGFQDAIRIARAAFPNVVVRAEAHLGRAAEYIAAYQAVHERVLDRTHPRAVFIVSYYGNEAMALIRACRRRGIATVDVQHGTINDAHWAYAHWSRVPAGGFDLLPRWFWVWGESEAEAIRSWSARTNGAHAPVVGGNLFLRAWNDGTLPVAVAIDARVDALMAQVPAGLSQVLYTVNGFETEVELGTIREAISRSKGRLFWWVRLHPAAPHAKDVVERALGAAEGGYRVEGGEIPLYALLRRMDVHVTEASSTVIEASELGVPTILLAREESVMYQNLIDQGWARVLGVGEDLAAAAVNRVGTRGRDPGTVTGPDPLDVVFGSAGAR
jgi:hypothetical protein